MPQTRPAGLAFNLAPETPFDRARVDQLLDEVFGPGRLVKTAERLREGRTPTAGFIARERGQVVGSVRLWPILIGGAPALFLGPIAVVEPARGRGLGATLVEACVNEAAARDRGVLLIGAPVYFARFGFHPVSDVVMPGPVDRGRILWRGQVGPSGIAAAG